MSSAERHLAEQVRRLYRLEADVYKAERETKQAEARELLARAAYRQALVGVNTALADWAEERGDSLAE